MTKYIHRPTTIEAAQWTPGAKHRDVRPDPYGLMQTALVETADGPKRIHAGDYVVRDWDATPMIINKEMFERAFMPEAITDVDPTNEFEFQRARLQFLSIAWQIGHVREVGVNGCFLEDVLKACAGRLEEHQAGPLATEENEHALRAVSSALDWLGARRRNRVAAGVADTNLPVPE